MVIGCAIGACGVGVAIAASVTGGVGSAALLSQVNKTKKKRGGVTKRGGWRKGRKRLKGRLTRHQDPSHSKLYNLSTPGEKRKRKQRRRSHKIYSRLKGIIANDLIIPSRYGAYLYKSQNEKEKHIKKTNNLFDSLYPGRYTHQGGRRKGRKGPNESAIKFKKGFIKEGNDGNQWIITITRNGVKRWKKIEKTKEEKEYLRVCQKAETDIHLNPAQKNFDCDAMSYDIQHKLVDKQDIRFRTKWYKNAIKNKEFDWDEYNHFYKMKKKSKRKSKKK